MIRALIRASGKLLYIFPAARQDRAKLAVKFDYSTKAGKLNMVVSGYKSKQTDIEGMIRGGQWLEVK